MKRTIEFNEERYPEAAEFIKKFNKDELNIKTAEMYSAMEIFSRYDIDPLVLAKAIKTYDVNFFKLMELIMNMTQGGEDAPKQKRKYTRRVKPEENEIKTTEVTPPVKLAEQPKQETKPEEDDEGGIDLSASSLFDNNNAEDDFFSDVFQPVSKPRKSRLADLGVSFE